MAWDKGSESKDPKAQNLTPLDIHNREFRRSFRGYDEDEVDEFLDLVVAEFERIIRDNEELQAEITELESRVNHYKGLEETLKNSIVLAQKTADQVREAAITDGETIKKQAKLEIEVARQKAQDDMKDAYRELEECRARVLRFKAEMRVYLTSQMESMEKGADGILERISKKEMAEGI